MSSEDAQRAVRQAVATPDTAVRRLRRDHGHTLVVTRLTSDVGRLSADLDELGPPAAGHRALPDPDGLEVIPDEPYDQSMWSDAEHVGFGTLRPPRTVRGA